jgi:hypothetical protein
MASLTAVSSALRGLSKPSRWRFLVKNSETEISRWRFAIDSAFSPDFEALGSFVAFGALSSAILASSVANRFCCPVSVLIAVPGC